MAIKLLNQIHTEVLRLETAWDSDLRPSKDDALALDELRQRACTELLRQAAQRAGLLAAADPASADGVISEGDRHAGLGHDQVAEAALLAADGSAADTVRKVNRAVLDACQEALLDDATVVCLAVE